ncbi:MAG TPA: hypothetical protein VF144_17290 [Chitinophagaceae bacterium]
MLPLQKFDCYGQLIMVPVLMVSMLVLSGVGFLTGLFVIGCWQLISAAFNTRSFIRAGFQKRISYYWIFSIADLLMLFLCYSSVESAPKIVINILAATTLPGAAAIGVYYWKIYFKLIGLLSLRNELDGLTKSKH